MNAIHLATILSLLAAGAIAQESEPASAPPDSDPVIQLGLFNPVQLHPDTESVTGLRLGLYTKSHDLTGIDVGLVNRLTGDLNGYQWGLWNQVDGDATGLQEGAVNWTRGTMTGMQSGLVNISGAHRGLQLGLWNQTGDLHGIQIGLVNINGNKEPFGFFPIVNWSF